MRNTVLGFLAGVAVTTAAFLVLGKSSEPTLVEESEDAVPATAAARRSESLAPGDGVRKPVAVGGSAGDELRNEDAFPEANSERASVAAPGLGAGRTAVGTRPAALPLEGSADVSQYPQEIANLINNQVDPALQQRYQNDSREESWATYMEGQLNAYFAGKPMLQPFNFSLIDCRTSVCSVHAMGYGPDADTQWNIATADIVTQPWHDFGGMSMSRQNPQPDVLAVVLILTRRPP